jgi:hypothetical protein
MALLEGGSTIAGYPIMHTGMPEIYMMGNINFTASKRMKFGPNTAYGGTLIVGGDSPIANTTTANVFTSNGNLHLDAGTGHGVYINWNSGNPGATTVPTFVVGNGLGGSVLAVTKEGNISMDAGTIVMPNNKNVGIQNASGTSWLRPSDANGNMHLLAGSNRLYVGAPAMTFESHNGTATYFTLDTSGLNLITGSFRVNGSEVFYHQTHGGGWQMTDSTWMRTYNGKSIYAGYGTIATDGSMSAGTSGPIGRLTSLLGTNAMPRPGGVSTGTTAAYIENNNDGAGHHGMIVATRWGGNASTIFEASTYWGDSSQAYLPLLGVYGDKSVRISRKLVIPVGNDMYAT